MSVFKQWHACARAVCALVSPRNVRPGPHDAGANDGGTGIAPIAAVALPSDASSAPPRICVRFGALDEVSQTSLIVPSHGVPIDRVERALIAFALTVSHGNRSQAARFVGLSRSALLYRMHKHRLDDEQDGPPAPAEHW